MEAVGGAGQRGCKRMGHEGNSSDGFLTSGKEAAQSCRPGGPRRPDRVGWSLKRLSARARSSRAMTRFP
eukprot:7884685-Pyramimonas_sp.AAC.1